MSSPPPPAPPPTPIDETLISWIIHKYNYDATFFVVYEAMVVCNMTKPESRKFQWIF